MPDSLGDRMKSYYEDRSRFYLARRTPVIMRLDGRAFHTFTKDFEKPFDRDLVRSMAWTAAVLVEEIQGAALAYIQSDEISILIRDYENLESSAWFDYNIQKMVSVASSMASVYFTQNLNRGEAFFDCRVFNIPKEEVTNYYIWRQQDWCRNSLQMLARSYFSQKELHGKKTKDIHEMLYTKAVNWVNLDSQLKNGTIVYKANPDWCSELITENREIVEAYV